MPTTKRKRQAKAKPEPSDSVDERMPSRARGNDSSACKTAEEVPAAAPPLPTCPITITKPGVTFPEATRVPTNLGFKNFDFQTPYLLQQCVVLPLSLAVGQKCAYVLAD